MWLERTLTVLAILVPELLLSAHKLSETEYSPLILNFTDTVTRNGYHSEVHTVITEDGYLLTLFRMGRSSARGTPTILMHGLLQSSDSWVDSGPDAGLAYLIVDAGHDLWMSNFRGNYYSRAHICLKPEDSVFWDFSVHEMGLYDVPALLGYVLQVTSAAKLNYIGFSQGAGAYFIMCSERPEYCEKANVMIALSPSTRHIHTRSSVFRLVTESFKEFETILRRSGVNEVLTKGSMTQVALGSFCPVPALIQFCSTLKELLDSAFEIHAEAVTEETIKTVVSHFSAGTSVKNMARYGQDMSRDKFVKFDYGRERNLQMYGSVRPPEYNLSSVTVPVVTIYGENDGMVDRRDVEWSLRQFPVVLEGFLIQDPFWSHMDMTYSKYMKPLVFPKINEYLMKFR